MFWDTGKVFLAMYREGASRNEHQSGRWADLKSFFGSQCLSQSTKKAVMELIIYDTINLWFAKTNVNNSMGCQIKINMKWFEDFIKAASSLVHNRDGRDLTKYDKY